MRIKWIIHITSIHIITLDPRPIGSSPALREGNQPPGAPDHRRQVVLPAGSPNEDGDDHDPDAGLVARGPGTRAPWPGGIQLLCDSEPVHATIVFKIRNRFLQLCYRFRWNLQLCYRWCINFGSLFLMYQFCCPSYWLHSLAIVRWIKINILIVMASVSIFIPCSHICMCTTTRDIPMQY